MLKQMNDFLSGIPMTMLGGLALVISFALFLTDRQMPVDPAWLAIIICGIPLIYLSIWRIIHMQTL